MLTTDSLQKIDREVAKYPPDQKQSAVMMALIIAQDEKGWLSTETMDYVAKILGMPPVAVYEVATFYSMYNLKPTGQYKLTLCTCLPCGLQRARGRRPPAREARHRLQRDHARRQVHAEGRRVHGRVRDGAGAAGQQQEDARLHDPRKLDQLIEKLK